MLKRLPVALLVSSFFVSSAFASYISLTTSVKSKVEKNVLRIEVSAVNKGDESAFNVQPEIRAMGKKLVAEMAPELKINEPYKNEINVSLDLKKPGQYPLIVVMHYTDANQYPFSALSAQIFTVNCEPLPPDIYGQMKSISFWKEGETALKLKNMSEVALNVKSSLVVPRELTVLDESRTVDLPPKTEKDVAFAIKNFSALSGSNYQVLAVSEYERDGMHQTNIAPGTIKIHESKTLLGINYTYLYAILAGLIVLFLISQLFFPRNKK